MNKYQEELDIVQEAVWLAEEESSYSTEELPSWVKEIFASADVAVWLAARSAKNSAQEAQKTSDLAISAADAALCSAAEYSAEYSAAEEKELNWQINQVLEILSYE
jgi:microcystin-dependent protein